MLEAIELETGSAIAKRTWPVTGGTVLQSDNYGKTTAVANDVGAGIIKLRHTRTLPNTERQVWQRRYNRKDRLQSAEGRKYGYKNWYGENIKGYSVVQPGEIVAEGDPTPTVTEEPVPSELPDSYVIMELDKTKVKVGDIITATIKIENMKNFAGYQLNIKYDPTMLEAIELETGSAIAKRTWPVTGGIMERRLR